MLSFFRRIFGSRSKLVRIGAGGDAGAVADHLKIHQVYVIGSDLGDSVSMSPSEADVLRITQAAADKKEFEGSVLKFEGQKYFPVFSSPVAAEYFCGAYCSLINAIHVYRIFSIRGSCIGGWIEEDEVLVFDSQSRKDCKIDYGLAMKIKELLSEPKEDDLAAFDSVVLPLPAVPRTVIDGT